MMASISAPASQGGRTKRQGALASVFSANTRLWALGLLLLATFAFGGGSRGDIASLIVLRPLSFALLAFALMGVDWEDWAKLGTVGWIAIALAGLAIVQLIPLPPSLWTALPGRELSADIAALTGLDDQWRPLSLSPSRTLNAAFSMGVPLAALALFAGLQRGQHKAVLWSILALGMVSAVVGLLQLMGPPDGPFYLYRITNEGVAVGLFANRNHHAVFLASLMPLLAFVALCAWQARGDARRSLTLMSVAGAIVFFVPLVLVTGSRAGAALALLLACVMTAILWKYLQWSASASARPKTMHKLAAPLAFFAIAGIAAVTHFASRSLSFERFLNGNMDGSLRADVLPHLVTMARDYFPIGAGLGAFRQAWEVVEPRELLRPQYLNQAHNDVLQFIIEGGAIGLVLLLAGIFWFARSGTRAWAAFRSDAKSGAAPRLALFTWLALSTLLAGSVFDYPLRTPSLMAMAVLLAGMTQLSLISAPDSATTKGASSL